MKAVSRTICRNRIRSVGLALLVSCGWCPLAWSAEPPRLAVWLKIGESYRDGSSLTPREPRLAWPWFARAAEMNHAPARAALKALEEMLSEEELRKARILWVPPVQAPGQGAASK